MTCSHTSLLHSRWRTQQLTRLSPRQGDINHPNIVLCRDKWTSPNPATHIGTQGKYKITSHKSGIDLTCNSILSLVWYWILQLKRLKTERIDIICCNSCFMRDVGWNLNGVAVKHLFLTNYLCFSASLQYVAIKAAQLDGYLIVCFNAQKLCRKQYTC
jgi:hypothetical protein